MACNYVARDGRVCLWLKHTGPHRFPKKLKANPFEGPKVIRRQVISEDQIELGWD